MLSIEITHLPERPGEEEDEVRQCGRCGYRKYRSWKEIRAGLVRLRAVGNVSARRMSRRVSKRVNRREEAARKLDDDAGENYAYKGSEPNQRIYFQAFPGE
jgi:hypothetical protein